MNGRVVWLPVAMVSVGLGGSVVTRQRERDQDKGSWYEGEVWGRCECRQGEVGRRYREDEEQTPADTEDRVGEETERRGDRGQSREGEGEAERDTTHRKRLREAETLKPRKRHHT